MKWNEVQGYSRHLPYHKEYYHSRKQEEYNYRCEKARTLEFPNLQHMLQDFDTPLEYLYTQLLQGS